ncbi:MAG: hypothetical protein ACOYD4_00005 [Solirubrobacterales bacterium]
MAGDEHRMVFDIRGKRRHVVKFVYAVLALLMGLSLFLVTGAVNIGSIFGNGNEGSSGAAISIEQAERIERKLKKSPQDPDLLAALTKTRLNAGNNSAEQTATGLALTTESIEQYQLASAAWSEYLEATEKPSAGIALGVAPALVTLAENGNVGEFEANIKAAAEAQGIVAAQRPSINSVSTQAIYEYFTFDYEAAEKLEAKAIALAKTKEQREEVEKSLAPYKKRAQEVQKSLNEIKKSSQGTGKESLENPLGGLGGTGLGE